MDSVNPFTGTTAAHYEEMRGDAVGAAIESAHHAHLGWRDADFAERARLMRRAAELLRERAEEYARLMATEMGKPLRDGIGESRKCAVGCEYYAEQAEGFLAPQPVKLEGRTGKVVFRPLGVLLAIMPWNFPFWQVVRFAAPALMAGNGAVLKHASNVPGCALALEEVFKTAGVPGGLFRTVLVPGSKVEPLIADQRIAAVTLTGSSDVGERVASAAGRHLKKQVLELGGSDPFIVLADADIDAAVSTAVRAR